jgi:hypothetical protein
MRFSRIFSNTTSLYGFNIREAEEIRQQVAEYNLQDLGKNDPLSSINYYFSSKENNSDLSVGSVRLSGSG